MITLTAWALAALAIALVLFVFRLAAPPPPRGRHAIGRRPGLVHYTPTCAALVRHTGTAYTVAIVLAAVAASATPSGVHS